MGNEIKILGFVLNEPRPISENIKQIIKLIIKNADYLFARISEPRIFLLFTVKLFLRICCSLCMLKRFLLNNVSKME